MPSVIEEAFGEHCNLYTDVLGCSSNSEATKAQLRKAYYRSALQYHPDKNPEPDAALKFQAISLAYQILSDPETKREYDETGVIPTAEDDATTTSGADQWKEYFSQVFGKVTVSDIENFATKYKCSDEERRDVLKACQKHHGDLVKLMDYVMLSAPLDAPRWVEDYLEPAWAEGELDEALRAKVESSLAILRKRMEKDDDPVEDDDDDDDETESEEEEAAAAALSPTNKKLASPTKRTAHKAKATKPKQKAKDDMQDLVAAIRNKRGGGNILQSLGSRYGVTLNDDDDDDPLDDAAFAKAQSRLNKR